GDLAAAPLIADFPLLVPAALVNGLLDATYMFVGPNYCYAFPPNIAPFCWPIRRDHRKSCVIVEVAFFPESEGSLVTVDEPWQGLSDYCGVTLRKEAVSSIGNPVY